MSKTIIFLFTCRRRRQHEDNDALTCYDDDDNNRCVYSRARAPRDDGSERRRALIDRNRHRRCLFIGMRPMRPDTRADVVVRQRCDRPCGVARVDSGRRGDSWRSAVESPCRRSPEVRLRVEHPPLHNNPTPSVSNVSSRIRLCTNNFDVDFDL